MDYVEAALGVGLQGEERGNLELRHAMLRLLQVDNATRWVFGWRAYVTWTKDQTRALNLKRQFDAVYFCIKHAPSFDGRVLDLRLD